jgi:tRNA(Ile2) C34 agmatinyltransferase TiaS
MDITKTIADAFKGVALGDLQRQTIEAMQTLIRTQQAEIERLKAALASSLPACPYCGARAWKLVSTRPHAMYAEMGTQYHTHRCEVCGKSRESLPDPDGQ